MRQLIAILLLTLASGFAWADPQAPNGKSPAELVADEAIANKDSIATLIKTEMAKATGFPIDGISNFYVDWPELRCVHANQSEFEPVVVGACTVPAGAFQIHGQFSITLAQLEFLVNTIYADIE